MTNMEAAEIYANLWSWSQNLFGFFLCIDASNLAANYTFANCCLLFPTSFIPAQKGNL